MNDSDDLDILESEVEKLAVNIEREMFNMYYTTDNKYKIKYRSLLLSLKDPKNKVRLKTNTTIHIFSSCLVKLCAVRVPVSASQPEMIKCVPGGKIHKSQSLQRAENDITIFYLSHMDLVFLKFCFCNLESFCSISSQAEVVQSWK